MNCKKTESKQDYKPKFIKSEIIPSKIDSLVSEKEVQTFVNKLMYPFHEQKISKDSTRIYRLFEEFELKKISKFKRDCRFDEDTLSKKIADSLKINKSFYKSDFDNNGYTDLLIIGDAHNCMAMAGCKESEYISCDFSVYSLMNFGNDSINSIDLNYITNWLSLVPEIVEGENGSIIELHKPIDYKIDNGKIKKISRTIPIAYKYGTFIELNNKIKTFNIENIEFTAHGCVTGCSEFIISIDKNKNGKLNAINHNWIDQNYSYDAKPNDIDGQFKSQISEKHFNELFEIINYLDFTHLDNEYSSGAMHSSYSTLKITYGNGKTKTIKDSEMKGTFGLIKIYELLYELRFNQDWKENTN